jgi:hypothetical protein
MDRHDADCPAPVWDLVVVSAFLSGKVLFGFQG